MAFSSRLSVRIFGADLLSIVTFFSVLTPVYESEIVNLMGSGASSWSYSRVLIRSTLSL